MHNSFKQWKIKRYIYIYIDKKIMKNAKRTIELKTFVIKIYYNFISTKKKLINPKTLLNIERIYFTKIKCNVQIK